MMSFSLTHPEPSKAATPKAWSNALYGTFQPRDYAGEALDNWLDCQLASHDLDAALEEAATVSERLLKGDMWLKDRGPSNPDWQRAQKRMGTLTARQRELLGITKHLYVRVWLKACAVHGCLNQLADADAWIEQHAPGRFTNDPKSIWYAVQPKRQPPFQTYPAPLEAYYVEHRFETQAALNAWMNREKES